MKKGFDFQFDPLANDLAMGRVIVGVRRKEEDEGLGAIDVEGEDGVRLKGREYPDTL
ncbi:hypothetical protein HYPBUDRAFT_151647 [Hyphopichia burtonii NRRL Y-1933]|uniref:Uncharacterized protein n=1 Tax=Hyphopichia burtonii NRRL Y-1933 TaxID=984485 RepID=A0A1E4RSK3_9ASCO|nr:hypothetical protein HYPBUDRAFT_151647 [Hyphopichia burtonii NRRL Y-1933]ODV70243.1 hypothetical protein HYPBUDRAFT_151647 [Hyphopichia burtonii NRRL Y-1933]